MTMGFPSSLGLDAHSKRQQLACVEPTGVDKAGAVGAVEKKAQQETAAAADAEVDRVTSNNTSSDDSAPASSSDNGGSSSSPSATGSAKEQPSEAMTVATEKETVNTNSALSCTIAANPSAAFSIAEDGTVCIQTMPEDFARKLVAQINRKLDHFLSHSPYIQSNSKLHELPRLAPGVLPLGKTIAKGGFSQIIEVKSTRSSNNKISTGACSLLGGNNGDKEKQYVVKCLSTKLPLKKLPGATKDIVFEAHTLSSLNHENIIKLRGWSKDGIDGFQSTRRADGFFIVLDRLGDTLFQRVFQWQQELSHRGRYMGLEKKITCKQIKREQFLEKIQIIVEISAALAHCHQRRIMHRDIKSANVAFDPKDGSAVLIDFGLATELPAYDPSDPNRTYVLTGNIGTARYMDPAVILGEKYNEKADVHSFAVLCWECCAGKKPYSNLDAKKVKDHVSKWHERPKTYWSWPRKLRQILKQGWSKRQQDRPSMTEFHQALVMVQASLPKSNIDLSACKQ